MTFKVKCINDSMCDGLIRKGVIYEVINVRTCGTNTQFLVRLRINNRYTSNWYMANRFVKLDKVEVKEPDVSIAKPTLEELLDAFKTGKHVRLLGTHGWLTITDPSISTLLAPDNVWQISTHSQPVKEFTIPQPLQDLDGVAVVYVPDLATGDAKRIFNPTKAEVGYTTEAEAIDAATAIINAIKAGAK